MIHVKYDDCYQVIVKYEVENLGPDNAHVPTLILELPPKVTFIRRVGRVPRVIV